MLNYHTFGSSIQSKTSNRGHSRGHGRRQPNSSYTSYQCQVCNNYGQIALICYHHFDYSYQSDNGIHRIPMLATNMNSLTDSTWYPNSSVTNHMTPNVATYVWIQNTVILTNSTLVMGQV